MSGLAQSGVVRLNTVNDGEQVEPGNLRVLEALDSNGELMRVSVLGICSSSLNASGTINCIRSIQKRFNNGRKPGY